MIFYCIKMSQQLWHSLLPLNYRLRTMIRSHGSHQKLAVLVAAESKPTFCSLSKFDKNRIFICRYGTCCLVSYFYSHRAAQGKIMKYVVALEESR